jgi:type IV pilus assembly protein PilC
MAFQLDKIESKEKKSSSFDINTLLKKEVSFGNSFSNKKKEVFYLDLHVLLEAGLTLKDGLSLIAEDKKKESDLIKRIINELVGGKNLSEAIKNQKEFSAYEYHSLKIGEQTGALLSVTKELGFFYKRKNEQKRTVMSALSYPIVVLCTAVLAILFMLQFVVPMFADIFKQNKVELPWITKKIVATSLYFQEYWWVLLMFVLTIFITIQFVKNKSWYFKWKSLIILKLPFLGAFVKKIKVAQFTQAIALLTSAKVPLLNSLQLTKKMITFYPLESALNSIENDILKGESLHKAIKKHDFFDKKMVSLIKVADETNQNETIFQRLTNQYNEEIEYFSKTISATLEPIIILILGAIVATILIAMYLPMFKLSTVII